MPLEVVIEKAVVDIAPREVVGFIEGLDLEGVFGEDFEPGGHGGVGRLRRILAGGH